MGALTGSNPFVKPQVSPASAGDTWDGATIGWQYELERGLRQKWPDDVHYSYRMDWVWPGGEPGSRLKLNRSQRPMLAPVLIYHHRGLPVLGRSDLVPVQVEFHQFPTYRCYGLAWQDYPRVYAERGVESLHRMPGDDALCLYFPWDPPERRWSYENGLAQLFDIVADHLHKELWWRHTGGHDGGEWPGEDAEHGVPAGYTDNFIGGSRL